MQSYIIDILQRLKDNNYRPDAEEILNCWESSKTVSYEAMIEVQGLSDERFLPELIKEFEKNPRNNDASNILFLISSIVANTGNNSGMDFMYSLLLKKTNNTILSHCLGFYSSKVQLPIKYSIAPFVELFNNRSQSIRIDCYAAIANSLHDDKESILIDRLALLTKPYEIECLLIPLSSFCGKQSQVEVEKHLKSKSSKVRAAAKMCIASINFQKGMNYQSQINTIPILKQLIYKILNK